MMVAPHAIDVTIYTCSAGVDCRAERPRVGTWTGWTGTADAFGFRKDGRRNSRCPSCRRGLASVGARSYHAVRVKRQVPRDVKALRVIERWSGLSHAATRGWTTPEAVRWQWEYRAPDGTRGISLQDLWTKRMMRLAARAERVAARVKAALEAVA